MNELSSLNISHAIMRLYYLYISRSLSSFQIFNQIKIVYRKNVDQEAQLGFGFPGISELVY